MRRLVLHIGSHKTGTTSIQRFLDVAGDDVFASTGLRYVPLQRREIPPIDARAGDPETFRRSGAIVSDEYLDHISRGDTDTLVVEEDLSWAFDEAQIDAMIRRLRSDFDDLRIITYVRRQDRHLLSHYQQGSRSQVPGNVFFGTRATAVPALAPHHDAYLDHHRRLLPYVDRLGVDRISLRVFEPDQLRHGDAIDDFLALLGVDRSRLANNPTMYENQSVGKTTTKLGHLYNRIPNRSINSLRMSKFLPDDAKLTVNREEAVAIASRYDDGNARLAELFGFDRQLFSTDFTDFPMTASSDWTAGEVVAATDGLRRLTRTVAARRGLEMAPKEALPQEVRRLRRRAERDTIPSEDEINDLLLLALDRLNTLALGPDERTAVDLPG